MARIGGILLCVLIVILDVGGAYLGIQAELEQNKARHLRLWMFECRDPSKNAFRFGLGAAGLLCISHLITNVLGGCLCICSEAEFQKSSTTRQISTICLLFSWIVFGVGLGTLVIGIMWNNKSKGTCGFASHHFLSIGGISCFVHAIFSVGYYASVSATQDGKDDSF